MSSILKIVNEITKVINNARTPLAPLPPTVTFTCSSIRPGLSPKVIASNIIKRQGEAGAPIGDNIDGSRNISEAMEVIRVEEILKALQFDGKIEITIPTGAIKCTGIGQSAVGPITVETTNIEPVSGQGIIR